MNLLDWEEANLAQKFFVDGTIEQIYFENTQNFYKVIRVKILATNLDFSEEEIVVTGNIGLLAVGEDYQFTGSLVEHARYGTQFQTTGYKSIRPSTESGVVAYLSSKKFRGIGKRTAKKIVELFGVEAIDKILENPSLLNELKGLSKRKQEELLASLIENAGTEKVMISLNEYGFGASLSLAIYNKYGLYAMQKIKENPYQLIKDIEGIGYKKADLLAEQLGIAADSPKRVRAAILQSLDDALHETGNTYVETDSFLEKVQELLEEARDFPIEKELIRQGIRQALDDKALQEEGARLFENSLYFAEIGIASALHTLLEGKEEASFSEKEIQKAIGAVEKRLGIAYGKTQKEAIEQACKQPFFLLTGGPGTGKTTVINGIVETFATLHDFSLNFLEYSNKEPFPVLLAAPTGRAAKRMNEMTGLPASTIHRLLGLNSTDEQFLEESEDLVGTLLIVDEFSMVDTWLCNRLFRSIPKDMHVIFVGDKDQLPSVSPGQVFYDLLHCAYLPKMELTTIYRQGENSTVVDLAHAIKQGIVPSNFKENQHDRSFFATNVNSIARGIEVIVQKAIDKGYAATDIQVLAPIYRGKAGIDALNHLLQNLFNPNPFGEKKEVRIQEKVYRVGDKVLHLVNDAVNNVFNGDFGVITGIILAKESDNKTDELIIAFDQEEITFARSEWNKITLSYCISIHKSQGSEFRMVLLPFVQQYGRMLQRNLLYTAITRAKESLILLGETQAFQTATANESATRKTRLKERLNKAFGETKEDAPFVSIYEDLPVYLLTKEQILQDEIDAMIGMEELTPYDFEI